MRQLLTDRRGNPIYRQGTTTASSWRNPNHHQLTSSAMAGGTFQSSTPHYNPRSLLFLYVTSSDWNNVVRRAKSHLQEVLMVDDNLNTPLHIACKLDPPVEVVDALKDSAMQINGLGATPLHIAASHRCNGRALQSIIDLYKGALSHQSRMGRTPIHYACMSYRGLDLVAFQTLLEATLEESRNKARYNQTRQQDNLPHHQEQEQGQSHISNNVDGGNADGHNQVGTTVSTPFEDLQPKGTIKNGQIAGDVGDGDGEALMIADFINVLRRDHGSRHRNTTTIGDDEEDLSVFLVDDPSTGFAHMSTTNDTLTFADDIDDLLVDVDEDDEKDNNNPNKDNPNIVTWKDSTGNTPLSLLFRRYRERVKSVISTLDQMRTNPSGGATPTTSPTSFQTDLGHLWGKARLIVARLTEEQQRLQKESTDTLANSATAANGHLEKDDSSSSGSSYGGPLTAAAAWSSERLKHTNTLGSQGTASQRFFSHRLNSFASAGLYTEQQENEANDANIESADTEEDCTEPTTVVQERQFRIVHASVALAGYGCPPEMIRLAISLFPEEVTQMDEDGNLPLHIAATAASFGCISEGTSLKDDASVFSDGMTSLFSSGSSKRAGGSGAAASNYNASFDKVIKLLLKQYPQAAQTPHGKSGRLPLALAARAGNRSWGDGMKALLRAYPPALFSGSKGLIPVKLYAHVLCLIGGGPRQQHPGILAPDSAHSVNSNTSSNWSTSRHGKKIGFLHNLLVSKQRHIRERMALYTPPTSSAGRQRKSQGLFASNSSHAKKRGPEKKIPSTNSGPTSNKLGSSRKTSNQEKQLDNATEFPGESPKKVDPKRATTIFEVLRTKPELVEVGQRYEVERQKKQRQQYQFPRSEGGKGLTSNSSTEIDIEGRKKTRNKKGTMSRKIFEMITVFERKTPKS
mmetsp:Transcript_8146/g.20465  ORF Transcript_8146/g.20465 Transcript_8146/m.20465 type:complete len:915 (+) Transcript_8146:250-2994(+)